MGFEVKAGVFGDFETIEVSDSIKGHHFIFIPDKGALPIKMKFHNLDFVESIDSPEILENDHWFRNFWLMPYPNRTKAGIYEFAGKEHHLEMSTHDTNHALHGFFYKLWAEDINVTKDSDTVEISIDHIYQADQPGYPFPFDTTIKYQIEAEGIFNIQITIMNAGERVMPFGLGWHPYFKLDQNLSELTVSSGPLLNIILDELSIPTGEEVLIEDTRDMANAKWDHCFKYQNEPYKYAIESDNYRLTISQGEEFQYLQIFTPGRDSIAVEPMTCGVNALNTKEGLVVLKPGESKSYHLTVELKKL